MKVENCHPALLHQASERLHYCSGLLSYLKYGQVFLLLSTTFKTATGDYFQQTSPDKQCDKPTTVADGQI